jgi:hypothetical protein
MDNVNNPIRVINLEADGQEVLIQDKKGLTIRTRSVVTIQNGRFELKIYDNAVIITQEGNYAPRKSIEFHRLAEIVTPTDPTNHPRP